MATTSSIQNLSVSKHVYIKVVSTTDTLIMMTNGTGSSGSSSFVDDPYQIEQLIVVLCNHADPCHQSIYPPGFMPTCRVRIKQWTYDEASGKCVEFDYYPCGEERQGYDVFSTEQDCINMCEKS